MASGGGAGAGGTGNGSNTPRHPAAAAPGQFGIKPDEVVRGFIRRANHSGSSFNLSPIRRRRAHSTSSSSAVSHSGSLGFVDSVWAVQNTPTSPLHNLSGLQSQYGFRSSPVAPIRRKQSLGDSATGYTSNSLALAAAAGSAGFSGASSSSLSSQTPSHAGVRSTSSMPVGTSHSPSLHHHHHHRQHQHQHVPAHQTMSAPFPLSSQLQATNLAGSTDEYGDTIPQVRSHRRNSVGKLIPLCAATAAAAMDTRHGMAGMAGVAGVTGDIDSTHVSSTNVSMSTSTAAASASSSASASASASARTLHTQMSVDDGYEASSEHMAMATATRPKTKPDKDKDAKKSGKWKDTLKRRKAKHDAKRRDDGGLSDIAASAAPSQCTTPVPIAEDDADIGGDEPPVARKISNGTSQSPTSDREDGKRKGFLHGFLPRPNFFRHPSREATGNLSDGAHSDTTKKKKKRGVRKKKGHTRNRSEDLNNNNNNNEPSALFSGSRGAEGGPQAERRSGAPHGTGRTASASSSAACASAASPTLASATASAAAVGDCGGGGSSSDEAATVLASAGGEFEGAPVPLIPGPDSAVSSLRDDLSQDLLLDGSYPTPGPSNPATPGAVARHRNSGSSLAASATSGGVDSSQLRRRSRPYSSDVDTGEASFDIIADSDNISVASEPAGLYRSHRPRVSSGDRPRADQEAVDNVIDKLTDLSERIEQEHKHKINNIVQQLMNTGDYRTYNDYARYALELLSSIDTNDGEFNMMILLVMTSQLVTSLPDNLRHLAVEIERNSSLLLEKHFAEFFYAGTEKALAFLRRCSLRRRGNSTGEVRSLSSQSQLSSTSSTTAMASAAAAAQAAPAHPASPLASLEPATGGTPTLRLRGETRGQSARESRLQRQLRQQQVVPSPRLRQASSAPRLDSHLAPQEYSGNLEEED
ncbi:pneumococcal serine-rich repeat protein-like [Sycon ciliatum]|uniref:pneumococcal serine-rich repeat protein-like n=1 Tax=Sycon ciliatum TaxID=27933 RepID=UPI0031F60E79